MRRGLQALALEALCVGCLAFPLVLGGTAILGGWLSGESSVVVFGLAAAVLLGVELRQSGVAALRAEPTKKFRRIA